MNSRAALIEAAFEEFSVKGYEAATVAGIADRAGVTTGALYAHFSGKLELLLETVGLVPVEDVVRTVADLAALPWNEAARQLSEGMSAEPDPRTVLLLDAIVAARRDPDVAGILRRGLDHYLNEIAKATEVGAALGLIDPALAPDDLTRVMALINLGMIVFAALGEPAPTPDALACLAGLLLQSSGATERDQPSALLRIRARAERLDRSQNELTEAIVGAAAEGHSLRQIGAAAGISHEQVRQLVRRRAAD